LADEAPEAEWLSQAPASTYTASNCGVSVSSRTPYLALSRRFHFELEYTAINANTPPGAAAVIHLTRLRYALETGVRASQNFGRPKFYPEMPLDKDRAVWEIPGPLATLLR